MITVARFLERAALHVIVDGKIRAKFQDLRCARSGIFVLPAVVAAQLGPAAILAYLVCALAMGLVLL